jgi:hypothetical protein
VLVFGLLLIPFLNSCSYYATFPSGTKQLGFTFEYPRSWRISSIDHYSDATVAFIYGPDTSANEAGVYMYLAVNYGYGLQADDEAKATQAREISINKNSRNFSIIRQETVYMNGFEGYLTEFAYDFRRSEWLPPSKWTYVPIRTIIVYVPRNGSVYELMIEASQNEWNTWEVDIQHVLDTFVWRPAVGCRVRPCSVATYHWERRRYYLLWITPLNLWRNRSNSLRRHR